MMTNREAIRYLKTWRITGDRSHEALDMAISALQAQDSPKPIAESVQNVQNEDLISRKAAIDVLGVFTQADALGHTPKQIVEALPSAQPDTKAQLPGEGTTFDLISRQAAIEAMSESLKRVFPEHRQIAEKCLNVLPSAQPKIVRCKDCKYR